MPVVEMVHARRMKREGEVGEDNKCSGLKEACEKDEEEEGRTNVCGREGTCKKDEGEGGEDKCLRRRGYM